MNPPPGEGVQVNRERRDEGLAFASRHFRNAASVQNDAADQLYIKMNHVPEQRLVANHDLLAAQPPGRIFYDSKGLGQDRIELGSQQIPVFNLGQPFFPAGGHGAEIGGGARLQPGFNLVDFTHNRLQPAYLTLVF